jgi:hypothetical protein
MKSFVVSRVSAALNSRRNATEVADYKRRNRSPWI